MKKIYYLMIKIIDWIKYKKSQCLEIKKIKEKKRVEIQSRVTLTKMQKKEIDDLYKLKLGKKVLYNWHKNYYSISGKFDYKYFPELLYIPGIERLLNNPKYYGCLQDKSMIEIFVKGLDYVKPLETYIRCANGLLTDSNYNIIDIEEAASILCKKEKFFIKPTIDSCSGKDCRICIPKEDYDNLTREKILDILKNYGKNYIVQKVVKNSEELKKLNPTSLNSFRIITYILDGKIYHMPISLKMGRSNGYLDNAHAGGIFIGIDDEGNLSEYAHSEFGENFDKHPDTNVIFKGYKIARVPQVLEVAHKLQTLFPHVGCINWDLTIDENGNIVLIEGNMRNGSIWHPQMANGKSAFGDNTERILEIVKENKKLY